MKKLFRAMAIGLINTILLLNAVGIGHATAAAKNSDCLSPAIHINNQGVTRMFKPSEVPLHLINLLWDEHREERFFAAISLYNVGTPSARAYAYLGFLSVYIFLDAPKDMAELIGRLGEKGREVFARKNSALEMADDALHNGWTDLELGKIFLPVSPATPDISI
ncbi:MAG: hypothetical protein ABII88_11715 [Candidatus Omnitrophota bacterium]